MISVICCIGNKDIYGVFLLNVKMWCLNENFRFVFVYYVCDRIYVCMCFNF